MLYKTEAEADVYHEKLKQTTTVFVTPDELKALEDQKLEENLSDVEENVSEMLNNVYYPSESGGNPDHLIYEEPKKVEDLAVDVDAWLRELEED